MGALIIPGRGGLARARRDQTYDRPDNNLAPGQSGVFRGKQVIIFGNSPATGLFEYAGTPAPGNSPILWAVPPGVTSDPFTNSLAVSGGLAVARYVSNVIQELIWLDPSTGTLFLGAGPRTSTYRMASLGVFGSLPFELDIVSAFDTSAAPANVGFRLQSGPSSNAGQALLASPAGANPIGLALLELGVGGSGFPQTLALGIGTPITDTVYRWVIDKNGRMQWGPGGAGALDTVLARNGPAALGLSGLLLATGALQSETSVQIFQAASTTNVFTIGALLAANNQFNIDANGKHTWGTGAAAVDTDLARVIDSNSNPVLHSDNGGEFLTLNIPANSATAAHFGVDSGGLIYLIGGTVATALRALAKLAADTNNRWQMDANGLMSWGTGAAAVDTLLQRTGAATLQLTSVLDLVDAVTPGTPTGASALYSKTGNLHYISSDGNEYNTGALRLGVFPAFLVNATTAQNVTGASVAVAARRYRFRMHVWYSTSAAAGAPTLDVTGPATTGNAFKDVSYIQQGNPASANARALNSISGGLGQGIPLAASGGVAFVEGDATFSAAGTLQLTALTSIAADTFTINYVSIDLYPIT